MAIVEQELHPNLDEDHVRGGVTGHNVRYVLGGSLFAVIAGLMLVAVLA